VLYNEGGGKLYWFKKSESKSVTCFREQGLYIVCDKLSSLFSLCSKSELSHQQRQCSDVGKTVEILIFVFLYESCIVCTCSLSCFARFFGTFASAASFIALHFGGPMS